MGRWMRLGTFIGTHMAFVSPACVALGVLFPDQLSLLKPFVTALFAFMTFQGALSNTFGNLVRVVRRPLPLLACLGVTAVAMPVLARALGGLLFGASPSLVCGIVLEYSVPVAVVSGMWIALFGGDPALGLATTLASTVLSPLTIPLTLHVLLGQTVEVDAAGMMGDMLVAVALPALAGTALNEATRGRAAREASPVLAPAAKTALVLVILANSTGVAPYVRSLTPQLVLVAAFVGAFASSGYVWGIAAARLLGQPRERLVSMAYLCGMRNISAGAVLAGAYFPGEVMFPVVIGTLFQQVLAAACGSYLRRVPEAPDATGGPGGSAGVLPARGDAGL